MTRPKIRTAAVPALLAVAWGAVLAWQLLEHGRVRRSAETALINRARDISTSLSVVVKSQRPFVPHFRLEAALEELAGLSEVRSVALLNSMGEVVASGGEPIVQEIGDLPEGGVRWDANSATFVNLVDLGATASIEGATRPTLVVWPAPEPEAASGEVRGSTREGTFPGLFPDRPWLRGREPRDSSPPPGEGGPIRERESEEVRSATGPRRESGRRFRSWHQFRPPPWMTREEFDSMLQERGLHGFVLVMSTQECRAAISGDRWVRLTIIGLALAAVVGLGSAWRTIGRSTALQIRLIRAGEMNARLREMNVAAAGLAHETRNPLNIVRGLAQMVEKRPDAPEETRQRAKEIAEEVDRVTARLNEFLDYSRPRDPKPAPTRLDSVVLDVVRTLEGDIEDKKIHFTITGAEVGILADEPLLRQVLFNLLINAVQAVDERGRVGVQVERSGSDEICLELRDDGPGVAEEYRHEIFRPYFTTQKAGTGLGLAVVRQIVLAHGWEISYVAGEHGGSIFRITGIKTAAAT